jgi:hypothetical protein
VAQIQVPWVLQPRLAEDTWVRCPDPSLILLLLLLLLLLTWVKHPLSDPRTLGLERGASPKLLGCVRGVDKNHLGLTAPPDPIF